jgi:hypothetical protein
MYVLFKKQFKSLSKTKFVPGMINTFGLPIDIIYNCAFITVSLVASI